MLMNMPRCWLEKGRSLIGAPRFLVPSLPAEFLERDRVSAVARGEPDEQSGRNQYVVDGTVRCQARRQALVQAQRRDECPELVTGLAGQQAPGELERVEYLGRLPPAQLT